MSARRLHTAGTWVDHDGAFQWSPDAALCCEACGGMLHGRHWAGSVGGVYCSPECEATKHRADEFEAAHPHSPWPDDREGPV
jgi:hypothetical protein